MLLTVNLEEPVLSLTGQAFGNEIHFFPTDDLTVWQALIGVDVEVEAGEYTIEMTVVDPMGEQARHCHTLEINEKTFPTRYLTLPKKFVDPPESVQRRIAAEAEEMKQIFLTVSDKRLWDGTFIRPVPGKVISAFGKRSVLNGQPRGRHSGVDLRAPMGTPVKAPAAGLVVLAKELYFSGNCVIIDHGLGLYSIMAHLSEFRVKPGDMVERGQVVALSGKSGRVEGPHLHWSVRLCNARVDPMALLGISSGKPLTRTLGAVRDSK